MIGQFITYILILTYSLVQNPGEFNLSLLDLSSSTPFYEQSYFIVILVITLVASLITMFILRNKFSIRRFESYSEYNTHLSKLRLLGVLFIIGLPAIEWSQEVFIPGHISRWGLILLEESILTTFFVATLIKNINSIFINAYAILGTSTIICILIYRTFLDQMGTVYMLEVIVSMAYTVIVFNNIKHQLIQLLIVDVL
ncbi:MAG: hypothetical protein H6600_08005 [Flavobacteriales bacterium]|nr:hypothetical protein [Flavobacteriales bacterium]MCB9198387.1 hypothetical protein [Flavobacteriales bacterium]